MNIQTKARTEDTRARIMETAETLFRRLGYAKTAVADIASELGMSPANIYRFFPSKTAIVQAICQRCLSELEEKVWAVARSREPGERSAWSGCSSKSSPITRKIFWRNRRLATSSRSRWRRAGPPSRRTRRCIRTAIELILRDGIEAGEFEPVDPRETSALIMRAYVGYCHPVLLAQGLQEGHDLEAEARALIRFLLRAITPKKVTCHDQVPSPPQLRPEIDDFLFSSVISHQSAIEVPDRRSGPGGAAP